MSPADNIERSIQELRFTTSPAADERILADAAAALEQSTKTAPGPSGPSVWRKIMKSNWTKLATAAAIIAVVSVLAVSVFHGSARPAYAIEQTLEANRGLRSIHIRIEPAGTGLKEAWAQFNDNGELARMRLDMPKTEDGPKVIVWQADKAEVWMKAKNIAVVVREPMTIAQIVKMLELFDPKVAMDALYRSQAEGRVKIEATGPASAGSPITLVVNPVGSPERKEIYYVDPSSKLVQRIEKWRQQNGQYAIESRWDYLEYNQPADPNVFVLNLPEGVTRIDQTTQEVGLAKGDLSDEQIAVKVARDFFEALIAKDYAKAGQLFSGMPAAKTEDVFREVRFLRIVSIGAAEPHPMPETRGLVVPCQIEIEKQGVKLVHEFRPGIRAVYKQPDRWTIFGGI